MLPPNLADDQRAVVELPLAGAAFLEGPAGAGKTTAGVARLLRLLREGVPADALIVIVPQRTLAAAYVDALRRPQRGAGGEVTVVTIGGLAQRAIELFWPLIAEPAGFGAPDRPPVFLTLETAQYFMARLVSPLLDAGYFDSISIDRNRLYSQILDNLNKAAVVGFPHTEIAGRLKAAWVGESAGLRVFDEAQECADRFRAYCLGHNLLDFSLQYEVFVRRLWPLPLYRDHLLRRYTHLIADNVEEDTPAAHDLLVEWLPHVTSALVIFDHDAGYRRFLGADPQSAGRLRELCAERLTFSRSYVAAPAVQALGAGLARVLGRRLETGPKEPLSPAQPSPLDFASRRYYPEMLDWVAERITGLVQEENVPPKEIVVLAPFLTAALRFSLANKLAAKGVAVRSHRPSRALRDEPATLCLLTLAALCHPHWGIHPTRYDVAYALMQAIADMDLVRSQLLADIAYRIHDAAPILSPFVEIEPEMQERITFLLGGRYEGLRTWINAHAAVRRGQGKSDARRRSSRVELDHFFGRLFGELLSQPGYGFHGSFEAGEVTANLIESVRKFRQVAPEATDTPDLGREYVQMVHDGVVAAQYIRSWRRQPEDAVLLAPAYTFLMMNRPVDHQFWLDVGGSGWWERINQPLTHPYILSRRWAAAGPLSQGDAKWTDAEEHAAQMDALAALVLGLARRCRVQIHLALSELGEQGSEQRGALLQAVQRVLRGVGGWKLEIGG